MKPKTTIVLLILLVLIGLGVWLSKALSRRDVQRVNTTAGKVFPQATGEAKKLAIQNGDGTKLIFVHTNDRWNMIEPRLLPARGDVVESSIRMMTELTYCRSFGSKDSAPSETVTGLARPRWILRLTDSAEKTSTLQVGLPVPAVGGEDETYVRVGEQGPVYVVPQDLGNVLQRDAKDYRDMTALPEVRRDAIVAIRVQGRENYTLQKRNDQWDITQPITARAEPKAVETLLRKLTTGLQAQRFLTESVDSPASFGLDHPQLIVTVTTREISLTQTATQPAEKTYTLLLGNHRGRDICAMVQGQPEVFTLSEAMLDELQPDLDSLRANTLLIFSPADVDRVELTREGETLLLQRDQDAWMMAKPFAGPTQRGSVEELLHQLAELRADSWIAQISPSGPQWNPQDAIQLHLQDGSVRTLLVGSANSDGKSVYCQPVGVNAMAAVDANAIDNVLAPAAHYWSRTLLPIAQDAEIQGMTIDRPDGSYVLAKCDDAWTLAAPVVGLADAKDMQAILAVLPGLQAKKILTLGDSLPEAYVKAKDRITVSLTTRNPSGGSLQTWRLGVVKIGKDVFAWRQGQPVVAVGACRQGLYTTLHQPLQKTK